LGTAEQAAAWKILGFFYVMPVVVFWIYFIWIPLGAFLFRHSTLTETLTAAFVFALESYRIKVAAALDRFDLKYCSFSSEIRG